MGCPTRVEFVQRMKESQCPMLFRSMQQFVQIHELFLVNSNGGEQQPKAEDDGIKGSNDMISIEDASFEVWSIRYDTFVLWRLGEK